MGVTKVEGVADGIRSLTWVFSWPVGPVRWARPWCAICAGAGYDGHGRRQPRRAARRPARPGRRGGGRGLGRGPGGRGQPRGRLRDGPEGRGGRARGLRADAAAEPGAGLQPRPRGDAARWRRAAAGAFVCVSARAALQPFPGACGYITAKAAVLAFVKALDAEYVGDGVREQRGPAERDRHPRQPRVDAGLRLVEVGAARGDRPGDQVPDLRRLAADERRGRTGVRPRLARPAAAYGAGADLVAGCRAPARGPGCPRAACPRRSSCRRPCVGLRPPHRASPLAAFSQTSPSFVLAVGRAIRAGVRLLCLHCLDSLLRPRGSSASIAPPLPPLSDFFSVSAGVSDEPEPPSSSSSSPHPATTKPSTMSAANSSASRLAMFFPFDRLRAAAKLGREGVPRQYQSGLDLVSPP